MAISTSPNTEAAPVRAVAGRVGILANEIGQRRLGALLGAASFTVAAHASDLHTLLDRAVAGLDVVVIAGDSRALAHGGSVELLHNLRPDWQIVLVADGDDRAMIRKALRAGVSGYVPEKAIERTLGAAATAVIEGQLSVPRSIRSRIAWAAFSAREQQVLQLVARGLTNSEIADRLCLSESTVKSHLSSSFRKLGVASRAEAAAAVLDPDNGSATGARLLAPLP
jgi:DNA-binding NarL/FixJ family response regulator